MPLKTVRWASNSQRWRTQVKNYRLSKKAEYEPLDYQE